MNVKTSLLFLFTLWYASLFAQVNDGLIGHFLFDTCTTNSITNLVAQNQSAVYVNGPSFDCKCGVRDSAMVFGGGDDIVLFPPQIDNIFGTTDFSISFFFQPDNSTFGTQDIISKRVGCNTIRSFAITYTAASNSLNVLLSESDAKNANVLGRVDPFRCWNHVVVVRRGATTLLYINGEKQDERTASTRVDIENNTLLSISNSSDCFSSLVLVPYAGLLDEVRIYNQALNLKDAEELFFEYYPNDLINRDTSIFLGTEFQINTRYACDLDFNWFPSDGVSDSSIADPVMAPTEDITYTLSFQGEACTDTDTMRVIVIDPAELGCDTMHLPKAFTPNGDGLNDQYGLSNPFVVQDNLLSFEIFDRWGSKVFATSNPFITWDGSFRGKEVNPGVMLYKVRFRCDGEEKIQVGSLTIIR